MCKVYLVAMLDETDDRVRLWKYLKSAENDIIQEFGQHRQSAEYAKWLSAKSKLLSLEGDLLREEGKEAEAKAKFKEALEVEEQALEIFQILLGDSNQWTLQSYGQVNKMMYEND